MRLWLELPQQAALKVVDLDAVVWWVTDDNLFILADADVQRAFLLAAVTGGHWECSDWLQLREELDCPGQRTDDQVVLPITSQAVGLVLHW